MARYLKRNCGTEAPSNLIFFDTESITKKIGKTETHSLRLWSATRVRLEGDKITRRKQASGMTVTGFWHWLDTVSCEDRCTWLFAHNLSFDLTLLDFWRELDQKRFTMAPMKSRALNSDGTQRSSWVGKLCLENHPCFLVVRKGRKTYKFVDSLNYWQMSLEKLGEQYGVGKLPLPDQSADNSVWLARCRRDVDILEVALCQLITKWKAEDCGVFQMTCASLAMHNFQHTCDILTPNSDSVDIVCEPNSAKNALERESYFGGRIQAFFVGERWHKIYHLDCNSLYPYVMREHSYPRRFVRYENSPSVDTLRNISLCYGCVARVYINSRFETFPVRIDGKQYHCTGRFWTSLAGPELDRAISSDSISRIGTVQVYSVARIFCKWVDYWYSRKVGAEMDKGRGSGDCVFAKLILNSLSGKWAQHGRYWKDKNDEYPDVRWGGYYSRESSRGPYQRKRGIAGNCQVLETDKEPAHAFPAISAFITAYAREYMRRVINICPPDSVYYMATDSLICGGEAYDAIESAGLLDQHRIGAFKIVGQHKYCCVHGPNDYVLDSKQTISGHIGKSVVAPDGVLYARLWDKTPSIISSGPRSTINVQEVPCYYPSHTNRGKIREDGSWEPYRITDDTAFTDRPRRGGYFSADSPDREGDHIQLDG